MHTPEEPLPPQVTSVEGDGHYSDSEDSVYGVKKGSGILVSLTDRVESEAEDEDDDDSSWTDDISEADDTEEEDDTLTVANSGLPQASESAADLAAAVSDLLLDLNQSISVPSSPPR